MTGTNYWIGITGKKRLAFLDLLLEAQAKEEEEGHGITNLTDTDIREETDTFMFEVSGKSIMKTQNSKQKLYCTKNQGERKEFSIVFQLSISFMMPHTEILRVTKYIDRRRN